MGLYLYGYYRDGDTVQTMYLGKPTSVAITTDTDPVHVGDCDSEGDETDASDDTLETLGDFD